MGRIALEPHLLRGQRTLLALALLQLLYTGSLVRMAGADESISILPPPITAEGLPSIFDLGLEEKPPPRVTFENLLEKSSLKLRLRNFYFNRAKPDELDDIAWAQGGFVEYQTGKVADIFSVTTEFFGSYKLYGPDEHDGTLLLQPGQRDINVLGVANPRFDLAGNILSLYRQKYDLPYVNQQDNRMIPNTFEGYTLALPKTSYDRFQYVIGYIDKIKTRNEDAFVSMSNAAGVPERENGLLASGARFYPMPELSLAAINYWLKDIFNTTYQEIVYKPEKVGDFGSNLSMQYSTQSSVGADLLRGDSYTSSFWGVQQALSYRHAVFKAAFNQTDTGATIRSPFGSYPSYTSSIVEDFNRAGECSWLLGLSYEFGRWGLKDLSISTSYINGWGAIDEITKESVNDRNETDVNIDYKVSEGVMKGFWLRLRSATVKEETDGTVQDYRIIVNYELPLYSPPAEPKSGATS